MSPDVEWRIGQEAEQEIVAAATPRQAVHWRVVWVALAICLGVGLGVMYRSVPEPPQSAPTPMPTPPAMSPRLSEVIDREAHALADGDADSILAVHMPEDQAWTDWKRTTIEPWGHPADNGPLYTSIAFNLRTSTRAWADIRQFRNGRFFRETRFYLWNKDRWLRTWLSDRFFWAGKEETLRTLHFTVTYAVEDRELVPAVVNQLEADYASLCRDLGCASAEREMTFTVKMSADTSYPYFPIGEGSELRFPSPRVMGLFESGRAYDWSNSSEDWTLARLMVRRVAYGGADLERPGNIILDASATWAIEHIDSLPERVRGKIGDLNQGPLLPLDKLWEHPDDSELEQTYSQAYMLMHFIEQEYGAPAIARLLTAVGSVQSFSEAIEKGLGIPFAEFDLKWQIWTKKVLTPLT